jgi:hypothetical protein
LLAALRAGLKAALACWRGGAPVAERKARCSWFGCDPEVLRGLVPRDPEAEEAERWYREHFHWGWPRQ